MAMILNPAFSRRARICPACPAFTASGLMIENVRSVMPSVPLVLESSRDGRADVRGRLDHVDARRLHRPHLFRGGALAARDDGPRVPHAAPGRGGLAGDEAD